MQNIKACSSIQDMLRTRERGFPAFSSFRGHGILKR